MSKSNLEVLLDAIVNGKTDVDIEPESRVEAYLLAIIKKLADGVGSGGDDIDLSLADAIEEEVLEGKTFYAKDKTLKTGTLTLPSGDTLKAYIDCLNSFETTGSSYNQSYNYPTKCCVPSLYNFNSNIRDLTNHLKYHYTSDIENFDYFFYDDESLTVIPMFDTHNAKTMIGTFMECLKLPSIPELDTSNVVDMRYMFHNCYELVSIPEMDTSNVTNMTNMFCGCKKLTSVPDFDTPNVSYMTNMFFGCSSLIRNPKLVMNSVKVSADYMFANCTSLKEFSGVDTGQVDKFFSIFSGCRALETVVMDVRTATYTGTATCLSSMFNNCTNLTNLTIKNIKANLQIGSGTTYGHLLTLDSLINTIKELRIQVITNPLKLTVGTANLAKLENVYVKLVDITDEMRLEDDLIDEKLPCEVCESTDEGAMLITDYVAEKGWLIA